MTIPPFFPICPIMPVQELHGRTPKTHLARALAPARSVRPGDIVALRQVGCMMNHGMLIGGTTFIAMSEDGSGFVDLRLSELPRGRKSQAMQCMRAIDHDWEILEEFPSEFLKPGEIGPARLELLHCPGALMFLWLDEPRAFDMPPNLLSTTPTPAALFIEEEDVARTDPRDRHLIEGQLGLLECLSGMRIARLPPA